MGIGIWTKYKIVFCWIRGRRHACKWIGPFIVFSKWTIRQRHRWPAEWIFVGEYWLAGIDFDRSTATILSCYSKKCIYNKGSERKALCWPPSHYMLKTMSKPNFWPWYWCCQMYMYGPPYVWSRVREKANGLEGTVGQTFSEKEKIKSFAINEDFLIQKEIRVWDGFIERSM